MDEDRQPASSQAKPPPGPQSHEREEEAPGRHVQRTSDVDVKMLDLLVCPLTKGRLALNAARTELISDSASLAYPIRDGIPIMLVSEARRLER